MSKAYDVIVIGAGAVGTSCAYHLVKKGMSVALIDMRDVARGSSSHCDAAALLSDKQPGVDVALGYDSIRRFLELQEELSNPFDLEQGGSLTVCETEAQVELGAEYVKAMQADGYDFQMLDKYEMKQKEPFLADDLPGGFWSSACCSLSPFKLCFAFVDEVKGKGLDVFIHTKVTNILLDDKGAVCGVDTDQGRFTAKNVVNCAGVWSGKVCDYLGLYFPVEPRNGIILVSSQTAPMCHQKVQEYGYLITKFQTGFKQDPLVEKYNVTMNIEPTEGNNVIIGGSRNFTGFTEVADINVIRAIARRAIRFFPILKDMNCVRAYQGMRPYMAEHLPVISAVDEVPGFFIAAGHEGDGIALDPVTGQLISELVAGEKPHKDISEYSYSRYKGKGPKA
ncbi:MAG: FAD-binding oxidoreductase [Lachnospiraceae bacterium]|nr:FAD-binding oxidoreductase [Lachnospiraceae bacterium]